MTLLVLMFLPASDSPPRSRSPGRIAGLEVSIAGSQMRDTLPSPTSYSIVIPRSPSALPAPPGPDCLAWHGWAHALGGVDADHTTARMTFRATKHTTLRIRSVRVDVRRRERPLTGTTLRCVRARSEPPPPTVGIGLDREPPAGAYFEAGENESSRPPSLSLRPGTHLVVDVTARARTCLCTWHADLRVAVNGKSQIYAIGDPRRALSTTPSTGRRARWSGTHWVEVRSP